MPVTSRNDEIYVRGVTMKKTGIILTMSVNSQPSKGTQLNLICASCIDQAIHLRNEFRQSIHRNILIPLFLGLDTWREAPLLDHRGRGAKSQNPLLHRDFRVDFVEINAFSLPCSFEAEINDRS